MSIAVATIDGGYLWIASDTAITDPDATSPDFIPGNLKTLVLSPTITVAYSGSVGRALGAIRRVSATLGASLELESVEANLLEESAQGEFPTEFLLASASPHLRIVKIPDGNLYSGGTRYWIGAPEAVSALQEQIDILRKSQTATSADSAAPYLVGAFTMLLQSESIEGVGGAAVFVRSSREGFCYSGYAVDA